MKDSTDIVSFVSLSQAALYLDCEFFKEGHWAFSIKTPLRVVRFRVRRPPSFAFAGLTRSGDRRCTRSV